MSCYIDAPESGRKLREEQSLREQLLFYLMYIYFIPMNKLFLLQQMKF